MLTTINKSNQPINKQTNNFPSLKTSPFTCLVAKGAIFSSRINQTSTKMVLSKQVVQEEHENIITCTVLKHTFHKLSLTLLSLILPLSFLLLSRLTSATPHPLAHRISSLFLFSFIPFVSASAIVRAITGRTPRPPLFVSWAILCLAQVSVSLGVEATIAARVLPVPVTGKCDESVRWIEQAIFFVGLYQTVLTWVEMFVKPVADDTIFRATKTDTLVDRMAVGMALSALWLSMLSAEIEPLILAAEKQQLVEDAGWSSFVLWLIGFATIVVGLMKVVEGAVSMMKELLFLQCRDTEEGLHLSADPEDIEV